MGIKEVKKEILDNARDTAEKIINEAEKEKKEIIKESDSAVAKIAQDIEKDAEKTIAQYKSMTLAETNSQIKKQRLAVERDIVLDVFEQVKESLTTLKGKKRQEHIKKLLKKDFQYDKVYCAKTDAKLVKSNTADILGGVILENKEGDVRVDLSYEAILMSIKEEYLADIAKILFQ